MKTPLVSVIIPCFNQARYLPDAVESVRSQSHANWECIIVDDGSSDDTARIAAQLAAADARVRWVRQENRGLAGARNRGLEEARGDYIQFLDADDLLRPDKLDLQLRLIEDGETPAVVYCGYALCEEDPNAEIDLGRPPATLDAQRPLRDLALRWENGLSIPCHAFLFDARLFRQSAIRFDEGLLNHEDWDCWMRLFSRTPRLYHAVERLVLYRRHGSAMSRDTTAMREGWLAALRKQYSLHQHDPELRLILARRIRTAEREARAERGEPGPILTGLGAVIGGVLRIFLAAETVERLRRFVRRELPIEGPGNGALIGRRTGHRVANLLRRIMPESAVRRIRRLVRRNPEL